MRVLLFFVFIISGWTVVFSQDNVSHVFFANQTKYPIQLVPLVEGNLASVEVRKLSFLQYEITHDHSSTISVGDFIGQPEKDHNEDNSSLMLNRTRAAGTNNFSSRLGVYADGELMFTIIIEGKDEPATRFVRVYYNIEYPDGSLDVPAPGILLRDNAKTYSQLAKNFMFRGEDYRIVYGVFDENQDNSDNIIYSVSLEKDTFYRYDPPASDTLNPNVLNIFCYNPGILMPLDLSDQDENERVPAFYKIVPKNMDVLIFQEFFEPKKINRILDDLKPWYPYHTGKHNRILIPGIGKDDGVRIVSRYPILEEREISFSENGCIPDDFFSLFANKGVKYAKINKMGQIVHVFGTHTSLQPCDLYVMGKFIHDMKLPKDEIIIMGGDYNVDMNKIKNGSDDYTIMLDTLNALEPTYLSFLNDRSYTGTTSGLAHMYCCNPDGRQHLDYVFANANHKVPYLSTNRSQMGRLNEPDESFGIFDMGDHLPIYARFEYPSMKREGSSESFTCIGNTFTLSVSLEAEAPGGIIKWFKGENEIVGADGSSLEVSILDAEDFGSYTCKYFYDYMPDTVVNNFFDPAYMDYKWYFRGVTHSCITSLFTISPEDSSVECSGKVTSVWEDMVMSFDVYPNPAKDLITVSGKELHKVKSMEITDLTGRIIKTINMVNKENTVQIDIRSLAEGMYFLKIYGNKGSGSRPFIKMK